MSVLGLGGALICCTCQFQRYKYPRLGQFCYQNEVECELGCNKSHQSAFPEALQTRLGEQSEAKLFLLIFLSNLFLRGIIHFLHHTEVERMLFLKSKDYKPGSHSVSNFPLVLCLLIHILWTPNGKWSSWPFKGLEHWMLLRCRGPWDAWSQPSLLQG